MTEPAVLIALRALSAKYREAESRERLDHWYNTADKQIWQAIHLGRAEIYAQCADDLDALLARVEPPDESAPAVHHRCEPSTSLASGQPVAVWCALDREWQDGAAKQFDYTCTRCGEHISVNVSQWRKRDEPAAARVEPPSQEQEIIKGKP